MSTILNKMPEVKDLLTEGDIKEVDVQICATHTFDSTGSKILYNLWIQLQIVIEPKGQISSVGSVVSDNQKVPMTINDTGSNSATNWFSILLAAWKRRKTNQVGYG